MEQQCCTTLSRGQQQEQQLRAGCPFHKGRVCVVLGLGEQQLLLVVQMRMRRMQRCWRS
jgi:hypothetical protein